MSEGDVRQRVLDTAKLLSKKGLVEGTSGNVSGRLDDGNVCVTPSSVAYETMTLDDLVIVDVDGNKVEGERSATSEKALHLACYKQFEEVGGVIHSHARFATMFALVREPIPACIEEFVVYIGGDVPICEYKTTGSDELGDEVARHLKDRSAALLANHGMVTIGATPQKALHAAGVVERTAEIVWGARALGGIHPLPEEANKSFFGVYELMRSMPS